MIFYTNLLILISYILKSLIKRLIYYTNRFVYWIISFKVVNIRARACIRCRQYIIIHPDNPENLNLINLFDRNHKGHNLVTLDLDEVKGSYKNIESVNSE